MFHPLRLFLAILSVICLSGPILAQENGSASSTTTITIPEDLTPEQVDDLVARMSDDQVRAIL